MPGLSDSARRMKVMSKSKFRVRWQILGAVDRLDPEARCPAAAAPARRFPCRPSCWPSNASCRSSTLSTSGRPPGILACTPSRDRPAGLGQQAPSPCGYCRGCAWCRRCGAARNPRERTGQKGVAKRGQQLAHAPLVPGQRASPGLGVREIGVMRGCRPPVMRVVHVFEIERVDQRRAHAPVIQRRPPRVEDETGHPRGRPCGISDFTISPRRTAGKSYCVAQRSALNSRI